jgi:hypothetical protein
MIGKYNNLDAIKKMSFVASDLVNQKMNIANGTSFSPQKKPIWQLRDLQNK